MRCYMHVRDRMDVLDSRTCLHQSNNSGLFKNLRSATFLHYVDVAIRQASLSWMDCFSTCSETGRTLLSEVRQFRLWPSCVIIAGQSTSMLLELLGCSRIWELANDPGPTAKYRSRCHQTTAIAGDGSPLQCCTGVHHDH